MKRMWRNVSALILLAATCACQAGTKTDLPAGASAYQTIAVSPETASAAVSTLEPGDEIGVNVYQEKDLSVDRLVIDASGNVSLPLVGRISAARRTTDELATEIQRAYAAGFLRNPQVNVVLVEAAPRVVSVEGEVAKPGVYAIQQGYTLLSALALAGSPKDTAKLDQVLVFRTIGSERAGARFNLSDIRGGRASDPAVYPGDVIVVGFSSVRGAFRDILQTAPILGIFTRY